MSKTEERLTDALDAVGRAVRDDDLRPLPASLAAASGHRVHVTWRRWAAPVAAAAAVIVVAGLALSPVLRHGTDRAGGRGAAGVGQLAVGTYVRAPSRCAPRLVASSSGGLAAAYTGAATKVASGVVAGQSWSAWARKGLSEPAALEDGGLVLSGRWYGMCGGFADVLEAEVVDTGSHGVAYGYLALPGKLTLSMRPAHALRAPHVVQLGGVSFFVSALTQPACAYHSAALDASTPAGSASEHVSFGTCQPDHDVAITGSTGIWTETSKSSLASVLGCDPGPTLRDSGKPIATLTGFVKVTSGTVGGQPWSLWAVQGVSGLNAVKRGRLLLSGRWYGLCPIMQSAASLELIDAGRNGVVYGLVASPHDSALRLAGRTGNARRKALPTPASRHVQGGAFVIGLLPSSACDYRTLTLYPAGRLSYDSYQIVLGSGCTGGQLVPVTSAGTAGDWWSTQR